MGPPQCSAGRSLHCQLPFHGASNPQVLGAGGQRDSPPPHTHTHPRVQVERFRWNADRFDVYLCLFHLVSCKRVDLVVEVFNRSGLPLLVVGDRPEKARLKALAGLRLTLLGRQSQ